MSKRRNHGAAFKARVVLAAVKRERTVSELAAEYGVHPTMIHQWKRSLPEGAAGIFERGGKAVAASEIAEDTVRDPCAKIGELVVANDFLSRKLKPWIGKWGQAKRRLSSGGRRCLLPRASRLRAGRVLGCACGPHHPGRIALPRPLSHVRHVADPQERAQAGRVLQIKPMMKGKGMPETRNASPR